MGEGKAEEKQGNDWQVPSRRGLSTGKSLQEEERRSFKENNKASGKSPGNLEPIAVRNEDQCSDPQSGQFLL